MSFVFGMMGDFWAKYMMDVNVNMWWLLSHCFSFCFQARVNVAGSDSADSQIDPQTAEREEY